MATNINTILSWFKTGQKPTQSQFWSSWQSFWHKDEKIPQSSINNLVNTLDAKADQSKLDQHNIDNTAHNSQFNAKENKSQKGISGGYAPLNDFTKLASQYLDIVNDLVSGGSTSVLSAEQGKNLQTQINSINTLLKSDNVDLTTIQEIANAIKELQIFLCSFLVNDLTTGGITKALTAEMGKKLNESKLTATIATDTETQISTSVTEDNKVVSRLKLFNWWENIKAKVQTINAIWNFTQGLRVNNSTGNYIYTTQMLEEMFVAQLVSAGYGTYKVQYGWNTIRMFNSNGFYTQLGFISSTQNNNVNLPNKNGTIALINDFVTTPAGTTNTPAMTIPNGALTTTPQNGAIERDSNGQLWETHNSIRSRLITTSDGLITLAYKAVTSIQTNLDIATSSTIQYLSASSIIGKIENISVQRLNSNTRITSLIYNNSGVKPKTAKIEVFLRINNGLFANHWTGSSAVNQVKIMEYSGLNNYGLKNYQNLMLFNIQNSNPSLAQWSTVDFPLQTVNDGIITTADKSYYLRDAANSRTFGASEASFSFVFINTLEFADEANTEGLNSRVLLRSDNYALFIETIR